MKSLSEFLRLLLCGGAVIMSSVASVWPAETDSYVNACMLRGKGYFRIAGTDRCLRPGGMLYTQISGGCNIHARSGDEVKIRNWQFETRAELIFDIARNTETGLLHSHIMLRSQ